MGSENTYSVTFFTAMPLASDVAKKQHFPARGMLRKSNMACCQKATRMLPKSNTGCCQKATHCQRRGDSSPDREVGVTPYSGGVRYSCGTWNPPRGSGGRTGNLKTATNPRHCRGMGRRPGWGTGNGDKVCVTNGAVIEVNVARLGAEKGQGLTAMPTICGHNPECGE